MIDEVAQGIYRLGSVFGGRLLYVYLLKGEHHCVLIDSGAVVTPDEAIMPALKRLACEPDTLIVTHCDLDHQGGNYKLKLAFPEMTLACGAGDEEQVSDPRVLVDRRYSAWEQDHGVGFPTEVKPKLVYLAGSNAVQVDRTFTGGERLQLSDDWTIEVLHLPGHSKGHLAIYDPRSNSAITQDAVHGNDYPYADGRPWALMPTYYYIDPYLETVERLRGMDVSTLHTAHWPVAEGAAVTQRLDETRDYTLKADKVVFDLLESGLTTLSEIMAEAMPRLGKWDPSTSGDFGCSMHGHLQRLVDSGIASVSRLEGLLRYAVAGDYSPPASS
ncbi:MAG: MBL fold metallo-hydrolase [Actinomycetota bacterium]|nr:MBL fold metallo-hydrolase [Actinomycetota bacterium]